MKFGVLYLFIYDKLFIIKTIVGHVVRERYHNKKERLKILEIYNLRHILRLNNHSNSCK